MSLSRQLSVYYHEVNSEIQGCPQKMRFAPTGQNFYCLFSFISCFCKLVFFSEANHQISHLEFIFSPEDWFKLEIVLSSELQLVFTVSSLVGNPVSFLRMSYTHLPYLIPLIWSILKSHALGKQNIVKYILKKRKKFGLFSRKII